MTTPRSESMPAAMLTIAIPTFNRSAHLDFLLPALAREIRELQGRVRIIVLDNASCDDTPAVIARHRSAFANFSGQRNAENIGADRNIEACFNCTESEYVWIMGDDDVPLPGAVAGLLRHLDDVRPDLVYLPSLGSRNVPRDLPGHQAVSASWRALSREQIAAVVHVQFTFISGVVLRKSATTQPLMDAALACTRGSKLVQLAWTFEILRRGERFSISRVPMLMANAGNSGGYAVLEVFLVNHTRLVLKLLEQCPVVAGRILGRMSACYLPGLLWNLRTHRMGHFDLPLPGTVGVPTALSRRLAYRWLVLPIWQLPAPVAAIFFQLSRVVARVFRAYDRHFVIR